MVPLTEIKALYESRPWAGIHEGPSRYRDHKANCPDSYGPLTCSEEVVFMKAGQQGPQLSARVFLNHDLVTDCACVHKGMCTFSTRWWALSVFGVDKWLLAEDGHISLRLADATLLLPSVHLQASSVSAGVLDLHVWQTHVATNTHTHSLSLSLCQSVYAAGYVCIRVRPRQSLVGMNSCRFGDYFVLVPIFFPVYKSHINTACLVTVRFFSQFDFCGYCCWSVIRMNTGYTSKIIIW